MLYGALIGAAVGLIIMLVMIPIMKSQARKIPRFSQVVPFLGNVNDVLPNINSLLNAEGYFPHYYNDEYGTFKKGNGFWSSIKYIKVVPEQGGILVEGFVIIYGTESGLSGFAASWPKKACKKVVDGIIALIQNNGGSTHA